MGRKHNKQISFYVTDELHKEIKRTASDNGKTIKAYIVDLHNNLLNQVQLSERLRVQESLTLQVIETLKEMNKELKLLRPKPVKIDSQIQQETKIENSQESLDSKGEEGESLYDFMQKQKIGQKETQSESLHTFAKGNLKNIMPHDLLPQDWDQDYDPEDDFTKMVETTLSELGATDLEGLNISIKDSSGREIKTVKPPSPHTKPIEKKYDEEFTKLVEDALKDL